MDDATVHAFADRFAGRTDARGAVGGLCIRGAVTMEHYRAHLAGRESLGVYPLLDNDTCNWIAADFDRASRNVSQTESDRQALDDCAALADALAEFGINHGVHPELSKSKGAHCFLFFDGPVLAYDARLIMTAACAKAGITKYELFPKQDQVPRGGVGNYLNLPYFGQEPRRRIVSLEGYAPLSLADFLGSVKPFPASVVPPILEALPPRPHSTRVTVPGNQHQSATPCYQAMLAHRATEGERNDMATAIAMHSNRMGLPETTTLHILDEWNGRADPPLGERELSGIVQSIYGRGYRSLWCEHRVVRPHCQSSCPVYRFAQAGRKAEGTKSGPEPEVPDDQDDLRVERLRILLSEPTICYVQVNNREVRLEMPTLLSWPRFRVAVAEQARILPILPRGAKWDFVVKDLLASAEEVPAPPEASLAGLTQARVEQFILDTPQSEELADVLSGLLYRDTDRVLFRFERLNDWLSRYSSHERLRQNELWALLRQMGGEASRRSINNRDVRLWSLPAAPTVYARVMSMWPHTHEVAWVGVGVSGWRISGMVTGQTARRLPDRSVLGCQA